MASPRHRNTRIGNTLIVASIFYRRHAVIKFSRENFVPIEINFFLSERTLEVKLFSDEIICGIRS